MIYHVIAAVGGGWAVWREGSARAARRFRTHAQAWRWGHQLARRRRASIIVHRADGGVMPKPGQVDPEPFHVVRHRREINGKLVVQTYSIYCNNKPYLKPPRGQKLGRDEARWIVDFLNGHAGRARRAA